MASKKIQGITVEIGGDVSPLKKAIKAANDAAKDLQSELKGVESLLKMDPGNIDLLKQKEELLGKTIDGTKQKLEGLRKAKEQADKDMANGTEVNEAEYRNLIREIASTERKLKEVTAASKQFGSVGAQQVAAMGKKVEEVGGKLSSIGGTLSKTLTAPIVAGATAAVVGTQELRGDLARLEANAVSAGAAVEDLDGWMTQMAAVTGETDSSVEGLSNLLAAGFKGDKMQQLLDDLSGAAIKFSDTLKFEGLSDGLQETLATGAATGPFGELLERSGLALDDFNAGLAEAAANGTQVDYVLQTLAQTGVADVYEAYKATNGEVLDAAATQYELQAALAELGAVLQPIITEVTGFLADLLEKFNALDPETQKIILTVLAIVAAIGPLLSGIGGVITTVGKIMEYAPKIQSMLGGVSAFLAGPGGVVLAIAAVVAALVLLYKNCKEFRDFVDKALSFIKDKFGFVFDGIMLLFGAFKKLFSGDFEGFVSDIQKAASVLLDGFKQLGADIVKGLWNGIKSVKDWIVEKVKGFGSSILSGLKDFFGIHSPSRVMAAEVGAPIAEGVAEGITDETPTAVAAVTEMSEALIDATETGLDEQQALIDEYNDKLEARADAIAGAFGLFDQVQQDADVTGQGLLDNLKGQVAALREWRDDLAELANRGIGGELLADLQEAGAVAGDKIKALTLLSDKELQEYADLYAQKMQVAAEQAASEMGAILVPDLATTAETFTAAATAAAGQPATPTATTGTPTDRLAEIITQALLEGLNYIGNSIFDGLPKVVNLLINGSQMAKATWDDYTSEGTRRGRMFAPSYDDIYSIVMDAIGG